MIVVLVGLALVALGFELGVLFAWYANGCNGDDDEK